MRKNLPGQTDNFNKLESSGWIVQEFVQVEENVDEIIVKIIKPGDYKIFRNVLLNSSVLPFSGKMKILHNTGLDTKIIDKIGRMSRIRNAFAHNKFKGFLAREIDPKTGQRIKTGKHESNVIFTLTSNGKSKKESVVDLLKEFNNLKKKVIEAQIEFFDTLK